MHDTPIPGMTQRYFACLVNSVVVSDPILYLVGLVPTERRRGYPLTYGFFTQVLCLTPKVDRPTRTLVRTGTLSR